MAQTILGLDLGAHAVKAVLLESSYRGFTVGGFEAVAVPPPEGEGPPLRERQLTALRQLLAARGWQPDTVVVAFPGSGLAAHVVSLPFADPRRIEATIGFEVEGQIPFDLPAACWDWQPLASAEGRTDLWVGVARKEELASLLAGLAAEGLDPRLVVPAAPALAALLAAGVLDPMAPPPEGAPAAPVVEALLDLGEERTHLCLATADGCAAARTVALGAAGVGRALARDLGLDEAAGRQLLAAELGGEPLPEPLAALAREPRAADALRRALVPVARELRATLRAWRARVGPQSVSRLWLAGELGRLPGLAEALAPEVEGPVAVLRLVGPLGEGIPAERLGAFAVAAALALRGQQGTRGPRLNLRRGELAYTRDFQHLKGKVARLAAATALVLVLAVASSAVKIFALSRQEKALDAALAAAEERILGRRFDNYEEAISALRGRGVPGAAIPKVSAVDVIGELSQRTPQGVPLRLDRIDISDKKLHVEGLTDAAENVDKIASALRASRCFGDARSGGARKRASDGKFEFSIDAALTCAESGLAGGGE